MTIYVRALAAAMARLGVHTDVFTRASSSSREIVELSPGVRVISMPAGPPTPLPKHKLRHHVGDFAAGLRAFALGQRVSYDLVHSHYWQSGLAGKRLAGMWGVPLVHSHHTLGKVKNRFLAPGDEAEPQTRLDGEAEVIESADVLIASTDEEWKQLACLYGASHDRLKTLHPGVDHAIFRPGDRARARSRLGLSDEAVMLYAGRIQPLKGLELAVRAAEQLSGALDRRVVLLLVGGASGSGGEDEVTRLGDLAHKLGIADDVRLVGAQPHRDLPVFYRAADVVVTCSYSESFGLAALEAHACGTPVIGTAVGGLSHIVRDGESGFLLDTRDPAEFAGRLKTVLSDDDLRASFAVAAARSAQAFSWDKTASLMLELYECLIEESSPEACVC
ncbi:MAG: glycosyltransferase [Actinomycetota bacterium]